MSNVLPLFDFRRARLAELRQWFTEQAQNRSGHLAAVSVAITGDGMLTTSGRGIDPDHAAILLGGLKRAMARLEGIAVGQTSATSAGQPHQCKVIQLRPRSTIKAQA